MLNTQPAYEEQFKFTNHSSGTVRILSVRSNCTCTVGKNSVDVIKAGESGYINVHFDPKGRSGRQISTVEIGTDEGGDPYQLTLVTEVIEPVEVSPRVLIWTVGSSMGEWKIARVHLRGTGKVLSESIEAASKDFTANLRQVDLDNWEIAVLPRQGLSNDTTTFLTLKLDTEKAGRLSLIVHLLVRL